MFPKEPENKVRDFAIWWNNTFVVDYWYRQKHKIPFNSKQHRKASPLDIVIEWEEEQIGAIVRNNIFAEKKTEEYNKTGQWLMPQKSSQELEEGFYEDFNFEDFDDK